MQTRTIQVSTPDGPMALYEAVPEDPKGALVVVQEAFGVNDHIEDVARRAASAGYHAVAPHLFHRTGGGTIPYGERDKVMAHFSTLDDTKILDDLDATLAHLRDAGWQDAGIGAVGFCVGGRITFLCALQRSIGAAIGFYGGSIVTARRQSMPSLVGDASALQTPWLGMFGDKDASIPVEDVETLRAALKAAPVETEIVRYPNADHGFHCDQRPNYEPDSAADAWRRTLAWLERHVTPRR